MRLEDLTIVLRPRKPWEAVDLGCALVRRDFARLLGLWAITVLPLWAILAAALWEHPGIFGLVVWWLKPLYDRVPLHFISSAAFGVRPSLGATLKIWPRLWSRFLFSALFIRRLSPIRSFALPVWMLEGQRGKAVRRRVNSLATEGSSAAMNATVAFIHLELVFYIGLLVLTSAVAPESGVPDLAEMFEGAAFDPQFSDGFLWYSNILYLVAMTIAEPFYVGAGFGLYINSRTKLEGWDIELTFRKLAARLRPAVTLLVLVIAAFTAVSAIAIPLPERTRPASSQASEAVSVTPANAAEQEATDEVTTSVKDILAKPEFKVHKDKKTIWLPSKEDLEKQKKYDSNASWLGGMAFLAQGFAWVCLALLIGALVWLIYRNRHLLFGIRFKRAERAKPQGPRVVMGMDLARESLPDDLLQGARQAWQQGHPREALSLLYRGALSRLIEQRRLPIRDSDTEDDCLQHVAKSGEAGMTSYFRQLTRLWVRAAYAGIETNSEEFEDLCRTWPFDRETVKGPRQIAVHLLLGLLLLPALLGSCTGERKEIEFTTGYKGAARSNPFLAAEQLLEEYGYDAERLTALKKVPDEGRGVLVLSGEAGLTEARTRQLLHWVSSGGHLVYALAGCRPYNDFSLFRGDQSYAYFGNEKREDPLLRSLDVAATDRRASAKAKEEEKAKVTEEPDEDGDSDDIEKPEDVTTHTSQFTWRGESYRLAMPDFVTFNLKRALRAGEYAGGAPDKASVLGLKHGSGRVTILSHAFPLRNRYLADHDHARWLLALAGDEANNVQFVLTIETSIWRLLWQKAWMPVIALGILTLFWLWKTIPRFGPVSHLELHDTKHFSQHISALGHFFHGLRRDDILINAAADSIRSHALRRFPQLRGLGEEAFLPLLSERSGFPEEHIQSLLTAAVPAQPYQLVRLMQDLQTLRQSL